ncbi:uncharacterized protein AB675_5336 [Cyphellophora attinorum]|uniref:Rhodopsin domain-containing protein n=1 Tax=Cyphellophora attinorum TaxID=1664694 RepID=A0A0N0NP57_9EURO|nr:uncharacterized protein AB675_5336 [Phialophora attinorum]KPI42149.1 hypothetical protein AB675_5336 [Phialophora attinorum]
MMDTEDYNISDILLNVNNPAANHTNVKTGASAVALSAYVIYGVGYGLGSNIWDIPLTKIVENVKTCIQTLFICVCLHATALTLVKLSIISTYWRIFPVPLLRRVLLGLAIVIIAVAISTILGTIFQCRPVAGAWDFSLDRKCYPVEDLLYFSTAFSVFSDVVLCLLPLPFFWKLGIPKKEKVVVSCLFCFGLVAAVASVVRITTLGRLRNINATKIIVPALDWSIAEVLTGIVCACLPCLKPLLNKLAPGKVFARHSLHIKKSSATSTFTTRTSRSVRQHKTLQTGPVRPSSQHLAHLSTSGSGLWRGRGQSWYVTSPKPGTVPLPTNVMAWSQVTKAIPSANDKHSVTSPRTWYDSGSPTRQTTLLERPGALVDTYTISQ